jgi:hypothetical protein
MLPLNGIFKQDINSKKKVSVSTGAFFYFNTLNFIKH